MNTTCRDPFADITLDWTLKGLPIVLEDRSAEAFASSPHNLIDDECLFPIATLSVSALRHNSDWMRRFLALTGVKIAPHGKTTMAPSLFARQLADGAWGMTAATVHHVRAYRRFGVSRIFMANQIVGRGNADWIIAEQARDPSFDFYCLIDNADNAAFLAARHAEHGSAPALKVLIEIGAPGARTGVRGVTGALELARVIAAHSPHLRLVGVETFEGVFQGSPNGAAEAGGMISDVLGAASAIAAERLFAWERVLLSAGGSAFFDLAASGLSAARIGRDVDVVIRSGCYLSHDHGIYNRLAAAYAARDPGIASLGEGLKPALLLWAHVQSAPEPGRVICAFGKRDAGADVDLPTPLLSARPGAGLAPSTLPAGHSVASLYDQHAILNTPHDTPLRVGDLVAFGVSHPCTTFDRWRAVYLLDDALRIVGVVRTYF